MSSEIRMTAVQFLTSKGVQLPKDLKQLAPFGSIASDLASSEGVRPLKRQEGQFKVHTWPVSIWERALKGERPESEPLATHRQIAYLTVLNWGHVQSFMDGLDNAMTKSEAGRLIDHLNAQG